MWVNTEPSAERGCVQPPGCTRIERRWPGSAGAPASAGSPGGGASGVQTRKQGLHPCRFRCKRILSSSSGPDTIVRRDVGEEGSKEWRTICVTVWGPAHHVELAGSWSAITSIPPDIPVAQVPLFTSVPQGCKSWAHHKGFL